MKLLTLSLLLASISYAQDITNVAAAIMLARTTSTQVLTITASQGDLSTCTINKTSGGTINITTSCSSSDGKTILTSTNLRSVSGGSPQFVPFGFGDVLCFLGVNPTAAPLSVGTIVNVPANGLGWKCTTNTTAGLQTTPVTGTTNW